MANGGSTPAGHYSRNYVSGTSIALGLCFNGNAAQVFTGRKDLDPSIFLTVNTIISGTLSKYGAHFVWSSIQFNLDTVAG